MTPWIDPQMQRILDRARANPGPDLKTLPIAEARGLFEAASRPWNVDAPEVPSRALTVPGAAGPMRARLYEPVARAPGHAAGGLVVYVHGGGWTFGSIGTHDGTMRRLALATGCKVLGIDYRLAPEHPFPAPLDDVLAAVAFVEGGGLGEAFAPARIAIAGDSAGATLSLAALLARRDAGSADLAGAALFYGCYAPDFETRSHAEFGGGAYLLSSVNMAWYWRNLLGGLRLDTTGLAAPGRAELTGLPPLYLSAAGLDPLRDDTARLALRLTEAGVPFRYEHVPGVVHGCLRVSRDLDAGAAMLRAGGAHLAQCLEGASGLKARV